jgi:arylformamidase
VWGSAEPAEFARQSGNYQAAALALGNPVELSAIQGADHFSVIHGLEDSGSPVCRWLHRQLTS